MIETLKLAIVGSSVLTPREEQRANHLILHHLESLMAMGIMPWVVSGGAPGVDSIAEGLANELGLSAPIIHYPENPRWEPRGYKERNIKIVLDCQELLCIRSSNSTTYGSGWTAQLATKLGRPVHWWMLAEHASYYSYSQGMDWIRYGQY